MRSAAEIDASVIAEVYRVRRSLDGSPSRALGAAATPFDRDLVCGTGG